MTYKHQSLPTVTIGIPAYNEGENILFLLKSVLEQKGDNFKLQKIIVQNDGSTDNTVSIVKKVSKKYSILKCYDDEVRRGKMFRLNQLYKENEGDYLFTLDADIVLADKFVISKIVRILQKNRGIYLVATHQIPIMPDTFIGKVLFYAYRIWEEIRIPVNNGDHIHNLQGSACALRNSFAKKVHYPSTLTSDSGYLYLFCKKTGGKFRYAKNAAIFYRPASTIYDFRLLSRRSIFQNQKTVADHFGKKVLNLYKIPARYKLKAILSMMLKTPIYTSLAMLLNFYVRLFPIQDKQSISKTWRIGTSTKKAITLQINK